MSGYINTIADLEAQTYGTGATGHISNQLLKAAGTVAGIHTAHDGSLSAPSGINSKSLQQDLRSKSMVYAKPRM